MKHLAIRSNIYSISDLKTHYQKKTKGHWFDPSTLRFFQSRFSETLFYSVDVIYFVSSEKSPGGVRKFSVRSYSPDTGRIETVGEFQEHSTAAKAGRAAKLKAAAELSEVL